MELIPKQLGPFQIRGHIGRNDACLICLAFDTRDNQEAFLIIPDPRAPHEPAFLERFLEQGQAASKLQHPNLAQVRETGVIDAYYYIAVNAIGGVTLANVLRQRNSPMPPDETADVINQVAAALDYAHDHGFLHQNLTPNDIWLTRDGMAVVMGVGLARGSTVNVSPTDYEAETIISPVHVTPFLSPEQARGETEVDRRADVYSLGAIAYAMLVGRPPFDETDQFLLLNEVIHGTPPAPEVVTPNVPAGMAFVLKFVLSKEANLRYAKASEFATALNQGKMWRASAVGANGSAGALAGNGASRASRPWGRRLVGVLALVALILGIGAVATGVIYQLDFIGGIVASGEEGETTPTSGVAVALATGIPELSTPTPDSFPGVTLSDGQILDTANTATPEDTPTLVAADPELAAMVDISATLNFTPATLSTALLSPTVAVALVITPTATLLPIDTPTPLPTDPPTLTATPTATTLPTATDTSVPTPTPVIQAAAVTLTELPVLIPTDTPTTVVTDTPVPTLPPTETATATSTSTVAPTDTSVPTATATDTPAPTATATPLPTNTTAPTATNTSLPTTTDTPAPTATATPLPPNTAVPTATNTPLPTATDTPAPTATATPLPTNTTVPTATNTSLPTVTDTPAPTATATPLPTNTAVPTATNTPLPTETDTLVPTATATPLPTETPTVAATDTPEPTATPTATFTLSPTRVPTNTATSTRRPTATPTKTPVPLPTPTNTLVDTPTPVPTATPTVEPTPTLIPLLVGRVTLVQGTNNGWVARITGQVEPGSTVQALVDNQPANAVRARANGAWTINVPLTDPGEYAVSVVAELPTGVRLAADAPPTLLVVPTPAPPPPPAGNVQLLDPGDNNGGGGDRTFSWQADFAPGAGQGFEMVFWRPGQDPMANGFGLAAPTTGNSVSVDLDALDDQLGPTLDPGEYQWGVLLVQTSPYQRLRFLGDSNKFNFARGGDSGSSGGGSGGGSSSGE